jgi:hypothetical protein
MCGSATRTRHYIFELAASNSKAEFWAMNHHKDAAPPVPTRWYAIHPKITNDEYQVTDHIRSLQIPVYTMPDNLVADKPNIMEYPLEALLEHFSDIPNDEMMLSSQICLMLAQALMEHQQGQPISEIHMYGFLFESKSEYNFQIPGITRWTTLCEERGGIKIVMPKETGLRKGFIYSFEQPIESERFEFQAMDDYEDWFNMEMKSYIDFSNARTVRQFIEGKFVRGGIEFTRRATPESGVHPQRVKSLQNENEALKHALEQGNILNVEMLDIIHKAQLGELDINNVHIETSSTNGAVSA